MKLLKRYTALILAVIITTLSACTKHEPGAWKNNDIDSGIREDFHDMNTVLLEGLKANKPKMIENIMSKTVLDDPNINRVIELSSIHMSRGKTNILDEYYMVHDFNREKSIKSTGHGINNYRLNYTPTTREMYISFYVIKDGLNEWLLSATYNKLDYGWKICYLELNPYTISGKTAPQLYEKACEQYAKGYIIDAVCTMNMARNCSLPNVMWRYQNEATMDAFYSKVIDQAENTYSFPLVIKKLATHPKVFRVFNQNTSEGSFPMIYYVSKISLKDTAAIKKEHDLLKNVIGEALPGINKDKKYVFYSVFNMLPDTVKSYRQHFEITDKLQ